MPNPLLDITISAISLTGFGVPEQHGGFPAIEHFHGVPLYCHVNPVGPGNYSILINQSGPSSFAPGVGTVQLVTLTYNATGGTQTMAFAPNSAQYNGLPIDLSIALQQDGTGILQLAQEASTTAGTPQVPSGNIPTITTITVRATPATGTTTDVVFFTNIPLPNAVVANGDVWPALISWSDNPGGAMGPLGGGETP